MTAKLYNTQDWPFERIAQYGKEITAAAKKLAARFPKDCTLQSLADDMTSGQYQLWLVLDDERFVLFGLTEIKVNPATGNKTVFIPSLAGDEGIESMPLIEGVSEWAKSIGANEVAFCGRDGWKKPISKYGFKADTRLYRKEL